MRCVERVVRDVRRVVVRVVRRVESVCCACTVDTLPKVRAIASPIAQLLENPIRIFSSHYAALRVQAPAGDLAGGASEPAGDLPARLVKVGLTFGVPQRRGDIPCDLYLAAAAQVWHGPPSQV